MTGGDHHRTARRECLRAGVGDGWAAQTESLGKLILKQAQRSVVEGLGCEVAFWFKHLCSGGVRRGCGFHVKR
ncbi:MAG: hypothetical protein ACYC1D_13495, partial [Acidimicrobiales bacterium]